jgi:protein kinase
METSVIWLLPHDAESLNDFAARPFVQNFFRVSQSSRMKRFEELEVLGNGAFGIVTKCRDRETGDIIAIKKMKQRYASFDECLQLKEVKSLRKIKHANVVKLLQIFRENEYLYLVFELLGKSLLRTINERVSYPESEVRTIMNQILTGLAHIHRQGFFHRDMKPDNVCWKDDSLKITDFGLAREIRSRPPYTEYAGTRWYRAPEVILRAEFYNSPVDIWAAGVIMAELYSGRPLFQGISETDQLYKIFGVLGAPTQKTWPDAIKLAARLGLRFPNTVPVGLESLVPNASPAGMRLLSELLRYDPARRPTATQALQHEFFTSDAGPEISNLTQQSGNQKKAGADEVGLDEILSTFASADADLSRSAPPVTRIEADSEPTAPPIPARSLSSMSIPPVDGARATPSIPFFGSDDSDDLFAGL